VAELHTLEVVTPAANHDLVTLDEVRDELEAKRSQDRRLRRYIRDASAVIETYTRRVWRQETVKETFHPGWWFHDHHHWQRQRQDGRPKPLLLARYPVVAVIALNDGSDLTDADYMVQRDSGEVYRLADDGMSTLPWPGGLTTITYTAGYPLAEIPPDVQQAVMTLVRHRYSSKGRDPALRSIVIPNVQEETYWVGAQGDNGAIPPEVAGLLAEHIDWKA
jgi:hypothetical protein